MFTDLFRIEGPWPGHLSISARPRGRDWLEEEMSAWRRSGIDIVVSLLEPEEARNLDLKDEEALSKAAGMQFLSFPIADRSVPAPDSNITGLIARIDTALSQGKNAAIHCRQGVGRAGMIAAALFIEQGDSPQGAMERVSAARRVPVPETDEQRLWIESFAASLARRH